MGRKRDLRSMFGFEGTLLLIEKVLEELTVLLYNNSDGNNYSSIAQSVERRTVNPQVVGSSPTRGANQKLEPRKRFCFLRENDNFTIPR